MRTFLTTASCLFLSLHLITCQAPDEWIDLYNGENLDNWDLYSGKPGSADYVAPEDIFSVVEVEGIRVMRISGEVNASIATKKAFENYHLQMEFKWGDEVFKSRNSGLLYHSYGPFGEGLGMWMNSHELQLMTGNLGDSYRMGDTWCEIPVEEVDSAYFAYSKSGEMMGFGMEEVSKIAHKSHDAEKPVGAWNVVDLYCVGGQSVHVVNGETVLVNYNSGKYENGEVLPLTGGKIQLQSEGGELFIRSMKLEPISEIPTEIL